MSKESKKGEEKTGEWGRGRKGGKLEVQVSSNTGW